MFSSSFLFFRKSYRLRDNVEKYGQARQATDDHMAYAHYMLVPKATNTHSEYVILVGLPLQKIVARTRLNVSFYVHCSSC